MERLQKVIANAGITSRRKAEDFILQGRVKVNGQVVRKLGTKVKEKSSLEPCDSTRLLLRDGIVLQ